MSPEFKGPRRIVTGLNAEGKSYIARLDEVAEADYGEAYPGRERTPESTSIWRIWGQDQLPFLLPTDGKAPSIEGDPTPEEADEALRQLKSLPPPLGLTVGVARFPPGAKTRWAWHDAVDVIWGLAGELTQVLDSGDEFTLRPGDCLIQCGANRYWHNRTSEPAVIGTVVHGAIRVGPHPPLENELGIEVSSAPGHYWRYWQQQEHGQSGSSLQVKD